MILNHLVNLETNITPTSAYLVSLSRVEMILLCTASIFSSKVVFVLISPSAGELSNDVDRSAMSRIADNQVSSTAVWLKISFTPRNSSLTRDITFSSNSERNTGNFATVVLSSPPN